MRKSLTSGDLSDQDGETENRRAEAEQSLHRSNSQGEPGCGKSYNGSAVDERISHNLVRCLMMTEFI